MTGVLAMEVAAAAEPADPRPPAIRLRDAAIALADRLGAAGVRFVEGDERGEWVSVLGGWPGGHDLPINEPLLSPLAAGPARVVVPIADRDGAIGALVVDDRRPRQWDADALAAIDALAAAMAPVAAEARLRARLARAEAEAAVRAIHHAFFRTVSDAIRDEPDASAILGTVTGMLGTHLDVAQVMLAEAGGEATGMVVYRPGNGGGFAPLHLPDAFATMLVVLGKGGTVRHDSLARVTPPEAAFLNARGVAALLAAPVVVDGALVAVLALTDDAPRAWSDEDARLAENLAERTWAAISRARAEAALAQRDRDTVFLLEWSDAIRGIASPAAIVATTLERTARYLGAVAAIHVEHGAPICAWRDGAFARLDAGDPLAAGALALLEGATAAPDVAAAPLGDIGSAGLIAIHAAAGDGWTGAQRRLLREVGGRLGSTLIHVRAVRRRDESEALLSAFMERAPLGMHVKDAAGRYIRLNPELAFALGRPREAIVGRHPSEILPAAIAERLEAIDAEARAGATASAELSDPARDDHSTVIAFAFPIVGAGEAHTGGFTIDLTERRRAELELERSRDALHQSEKLSALGGLLAGVSHELNNPLSIVTAQADLIAHEAGEGSPIATRAAKLRDAAERCARITRTFLAMARQEAPVRRAVDMDAVVDAAIDLVAYGLAADGVVVTRVKGAALPRIEADPDQLHQIVVNLLVNAQHAMAGCAERRIRVTTGVDRGAVVVEIADSGPGVPEAVRRRIFDPFFTTKPQGQGTGMGLAFSQGLAEAHGGALMLLPGDASSQEWGATFRLTLPYAARVEAVAPLRRGRVVRQALIVDDERDHGDALAALLKHEGFQCRVVDNGSAAQALLGTGRFDLIVSDVRMPGLDGPALHRWVQRLRPDLARTMVFATDDVLNPATVAFVRDAGLACMEKPILAAQLREMLAAFDARV